MHNNHDTNVIFSVSRFTSVWLSFGAVRHPSECSTRQRSYGVGLVNPHLRLHVFAAAAAATVDASTFSCSASADDFRAATIESNTVSVCDAQFASDVQARIVRVECSSVHRTGTCTRGRKSILRAQSARVRTRARAMCLFRF